MEMHQVRYFLSVATHLNFTQAAAALDVTQPSLTRAVQKLETELGGLLFRRERANTHLTELGRLMLPHLQATYAAAEAAKDQARRLRKGVGGTLSIGVCAGIEPGVPASLVIEIASTIANLDVVVEVGATDVVERRLMAGDFDAAFLPHVSATHERFDVKEIHRDRLVVAFAARHRFAASERVSIEALDAEPLVVRTDCRHEDMIADAMTARRLERVVRHRSNDPRWIADFVRHGLGCAVLPETQAIAADLPHRAIDGLALQHRVMLATVAGRRHSAALAKLIGQTGVAGRREAP